MTCPRCGETNEEGFRFCRICGSALPEAEAGLAASAYAPAAVTPPPAAKATIQVPPPREVPSANRLVALAGLLTNRTFTIGPKGLMIGRDPSRCQVIIADDEISRLHAWVGLNDLGEVVIRDNDSANGTFVNKARVREKVLRPTDEISLGSSHRHLFRVESVVTPRAGGAAGGAAPRPAAPGGATSILSPADLAAAAPAEKIGEKTVVMKVTGLMARPHVELIVDKYAVRTLDIPDDGLRVGRDVAHCQLQIDHPSVSSIHAEFSLKDGKVILTDRSTNGTFVNGRRLPAGELQDGDYITFGRYAGKSLIFRRGLEPELKREAVQLAKDRITIGRDSSNDMVIDHPLVSKLHAEIVKEEGKTFVIDRNSTNGTWVNGIRIKRHQLQELDRIVIGPSELNFTGASLSHSVEKRVIRLDVQAVNFQVSDRTTGKPKLLLDQISLVVKPRELIGLLGPSGAGKSTLMNALNGFVKPTSGGVFYNSLDLYRNLESLKTTIGFVPQEDIMHRQLTVRRCLYYAAKLRLPEDLTDEEIYKRVDEMLDTLKLDPGGWNNPVATLSGGQRKRVSLGIELLPQPGILFLDEPTAGLDPRTETLMMMLFRQLANRGTTIIITTHLLGSFGVLDKVVVLVQGRLAYYGPGTKFLEYFKAEAPPDVYDELTDNNNVPFALDLKKRFAGSSLCKDLIAEPLQKALAQGGSTAPAAPAPATKPEEERGFSLSQLKVLTRRNWELKFGDRAQTALLFVQAPLVALLVAAMASGSNQIQTIFMAMFSALWFGCSNAVREIVDEQTIYRRERQTGLKIPSYVFSKLAVLSFVALAQVVSVVVILLFVNHALDLSPPEILGAVGIMFLVAVNGSLVGLTISAVVKSPEKALTLFPLVLIPELLLSGLFLPVNKIETLIELNVEQLLEGKLFAQPETKRQVERMKNPPAPPPSTSPAPSSSAPPAEAAQTEQGEFGHQVVGAVSPSPETQKVFHRFTPAPFEGMTAPVRWLSALAISRWGMEALSDLCLHGPHSTQDSAYKIINTVYVSLHPADEEKLKQGLEAPASAYVASGSFPLPSNFWQDKGPYLGILAGYGLLMTVLVLFLMKRKDVS